MRSLLSIGLLSVALFTTSASANARPTKVVRSPDPSVNCDKCRQWVRVPSPGAGTKGQPSYHWKRAPVCTECRQIANGEAAPATCKTCGGSARHH